MKRISILCSLLCTIAFTQCNKEEPISEMIAQEEESYENLEKVETLWKEGDEKIETSWDGIAAKELDEELLTLDENSPKMRLLGVEPRQVDVGVVRLSSHCGDYPTVELVMDCEDDSNISHVRGWNRISDVVNGDDVSWLTNYGIKTTSNGNLYMYFCLVEHYHGRFPSFSRDDGGHSWALISLNGHNSVPNEYIPWDLIYRYFDNEDNNNVNSGRVIWKDNNNIEHITGIYPKDLSAPHFPGIEQTRDTRLSFAVKSTSPIGYGSNYNKSSFPHLGFDYAVFSKRPVISGEERVAEVLSDDEDKNANHWLTKYNSFSPQGGFMDFGFIKGDRNTHLYVTPAKIQI